MASIRVEHFEYPSSDDTSFGHSAFSPYLPSASLHKHYVQDYQAAKPIPPDSASYCEQGNSEVVRSGRCESEKIKPR